MTGLPYAVAIMLAACLASLAAGRARAGERQAGLELQSRGYLQFASAYDVIDHGSVLNPDNRLGLSSYRSVATVTVNVRADKGGFRAVAEGYGRAGSGRARQDGVDLYQGYLSWSSPDKEYFLRAGRAVLGWGAGQIWNPVRAITNEARKDLIFPDEAVDGLNLIEARAFVRGATVTMLALAPPHRGDDWAYAVRYAGNAGQLDFAASLYSDLHGVQRLGGEFSLPLGAVAIVGEALYADSGHNTGLAGREDARGGWSYLLGANAVLPRDVVVLAEYYHDGAGMKTDEVRRFRAGLPDGAERYSVFGNGRDNLYVGVSRRLTWRDSSVLLGTFLNREGESGLLQARVEGQLTEAVRLQVSYVEYIEYSGQQDVGYLDRSIEARLRLSF